MHLVAQSEEIFRQVKSILAGDAGDERFFHTFGFMPVSGVLMV
jgi:hypothetical protein